MTPRRKPHQESDINQEIADRFIEAASLLERRDSNRFRVEAYVNAANTLTDLETDISEIAGRGRPGGTGRDSYHRGRHRRSDHGNPGDGALAASRPAA